MDGAAGGQPLAISAELDHPGAVGGRLEVVDQLVRYFAQLAWNKIKMALMESASFSLKNYVCFQVKLA